MTRDKLIQEEKELERKLNKEMPSMEIKKQDPFKMKGGWACSYEELKELLDDE